MEIREIQILLTRAGFKVDIDGKSGPKTIQAIKDFQKSQNLVSDGLAGPNTIKALQDFSAPILNNLPKLEPLTDKPTIDKISKLHPSVRDEVTFLVQKANAQLTGRAKVRIVQGLRTFAEQDALYAQRPKVTQAKGGQSIHNYGVAIDFSLLIDGKEISWDTAKDWDGDRVSDWNEVVKVFKDAGWLWGGNWTSFKDLPHLEKLHDWKPLLAKHNAKQFIEGTTYVKL